MEQTRKWNRQRNNKEQYKKKKIHRKGKNIRLVKYIEEKYEHRRKTHTNKSIKKKEEEEKNRNGRKRGAGTKNTEKWRAPDIIYFLLQLSFVRYQSNLRPKLLVTERTKKKKFSSRLYFVRLLNIFITSLYPLPLYVYLSPLPPFSLLPDKGNKKRVRYLLKLRVLRRFPKGGEGERGSRGRGGYFD